ncbi:NTP transferase domain-containing protein [Bordetella sp. N]|uniref:nucleotidyltransferase family protein n=1 Tax=Bordetella sp. N TaxID=1746199 RepID=UPI00070D49B5|nr:nucleotidyltransferase family protein [Bordetella sp. N]ALM83412.1 hypothetical protein ASB57_10945 [Bordetella sp. N]
MPTNAPHSDPAADLPAYVGILLAGGAGARYRASAGDDGADKLLALLPDGRPIVVAAAMALREVATRVLVVLRPGRSALRDALARVPGCELIESVEAERGMGASLAAAARHLCAQDAPGDGAGGVSARGMGTVSAGGVVAVPAHGVVAVSARGVAAVPARGVLVALGDMPWVTPATLQAICQAGAGHPIVAPEYDGRRGHPVAFAWDLLPELARLDGDTGARVLLQRHGVHLLPCHDAGVLRDVDTIADLA